MNKTKTEHIIELQWEAFQNDWKDLSSHDVSYHTISETPNCHISKRYDHFDIKFRELETSQIRAATCQSASCIEALGLEVSTATIVNFCHIITMTS